MVFSVEFLIKCFWYALAGVPTTLLITAFALIVATIFGYFLAIARINKIKVLSTVSMLYVSFVRGTPLIVQIYIVYNLMPKLLLGFFQSINWEVDVYRFNPIIYAFIVFSFNSTAALTEVFRSALAAIDKGQKEAAFSIGMTSFQAYTRIIIPQAFLVALPNYCTQTLNLVKATSLAFVMTVLEITGRAKSLAGIGYNYLECFIDVFVIYLILCYGIERIFILIEKRMKVYRGQTI